MQLTLPARYYTDESIFRAELERFYCRMWVCAGRAEQVAEKNQFFIAEIAGESLIVTRDNAGALHAFYNVCRHRGTRLCTEPSGCFGGRIQCPYHGWTYSLDGTLLGAPHMDPQQFRREEYPLHAVSIDIWDGHIFLNLAKQPQSLRKQLADLPQKFASWHMEELRIGKRANYAVHANWKLIVLNYNECLHCPILHPTLSRVTDSMSGDNDPPNSSYIGGSMDFRGDAQTMSIDGVRCRDYLPGLNHEQRQHVLYYATYPNLFLSLHPDYVMVHRLWPKAVDRTEVVTEWLFHPTEMAKPNFVPDDAVDFWDKTNKEDWHICELSQQGISSRAYVPGPYSQQESLPSAFDRMILQRKQDSKSE
jgi:Rieske 2Fe-2S family protein